LATLAAPSRALADDAQVESGFALQANLAVRSSVLSTVSGGMGNTTSIGLPDNGIQTQLFGGYKTGRLLIGLGLEFQNGTANTSTSVGTTTTSTSSSTSAFLIGPEAQFALLRSGDNRVELVGDLALHFGHLFLPNVNDGSSNFLLTYQLGPGVRFWAHKHFALVGLTGFAGELYHYIPPSGANVTADISSHGIFGSFGMLGVF
jgi:hypothetical protein